MCGVSVYPQSKHTAPRCPLGGSSERRTRACQYVNHSVKQALIITSWKCKGLMKHCGILLMSYTISSIQTCVLTNTNKSQHIRAKSIHTTQWNYKSSIHIYMEIPREFYINYSIHYEQVCKDTVHCYLFSRFTCIATALVVTIVFITTFHTAVI